MSPGPAQSLDWKWSRISSSNCTSN